MRVNIGRADKFIRIVIGALLLILAATGTLGLWAWIGIVPLATGLMGWCPAYALLGIKTDPAKKE